MVSLEVTGIAIVSRRGLRRAQRGVPELQSEDIVAYEGDGGPFVDLVDEASLPVGTAVWDPTGGVAVRLLSSARTHDPVGLLRTRIERALARRKADLGVELVGDGAARLVNDAADGVPGVCIDRFGPGLLVSVDAAPMRAALDLVLPSLCEQLGTSHLVLHDASGASILRGDGSRVRFAHGRLDVEIDLCAPMASALSADLERQRTLSRWARGRVLDAGAGLGGYGLQLADAGACAVTFVDAPALLSSSLFDDAARNGLDAKLERIAEDAAAWLRATEVERLNFDVVVFHPYPVAHTGLERALGDITEIASALTKLLNEGGVLAASPAYREISDELFIGALQEAAARTRRRLQILARLDTGPDHPTLAGCPLPASLVVARVLQTS
jgi:23S rRNA (cytosine1962-C5)-methyltransferase